MFELTSDTCSTDELGTADFLAGRFDDELGCGLVMVSRRNR
jgi:hypothetical protein